MVMITPEEVMEMRRREQQSDVEPERPTKLYRHYDADGKLLYVGITATILKRVVAHERSDWADQIATITIQSYASRQEAEDAEQDAVVAENPLYNKNLRSKWGVNEVREIRAALRGTADRMRREGVSEKAIDDMLKSAKANLSAANRKARS